MVLCYRSLAILDFATCTSYFVSSIAMSSDSASESGSEYLPGSSDDEESDESHVCGESELEDDSDEELYEEDIEPFIEEGWQFMSDPFADARPNPLPVFSDADAGIVSSVPQFSCPREAFCYFFDSDVIDKLCQWMNARAAAHFTATGKRKVNGLLWRSVGADEMYVFLSLLMVMGMNKLPRIYMCWSRRDQQ